MSTELHAEIDMADFNKKFKEYMKLTSRTLQDACNQKLFDICRFALKDTAKADSSHIRQQMDAMSKKYPERTLAEMIAIMRNRGKEFNLDEEARRVTSKAVGAAGYTRSGWIKPMVAIAPYIGKHSVTASGVSKHIGPGGANPAKAPHMNVVAEAWNDVTAKTGDGKLTQIKEAGLQSGINKAVADMDSYLEKKMQQAGKVF